MGVSKIQFHSLIETIYGNLTSQWWFWVRRTCLPRGQSFWTWMEWMEWMEFVLATIWGLTDSLSPFLIFINNILISWWYSILVSFSFGGDWQRSCESFHCPFSRSSFYNSLFFLGMVGVPVQTRNPEVSDESGWSNGGRSWTWRLERRGLTFRRRFWEGMIGLRTSWGVGGMPSTMKLGEVSGKCRTKKQH